MTKSELQPLFLENVTEMMRGARSRVSKEIQSLSESEREIVDKVVWNEIKGIVHGIMCEFDGATSLADDGLLTIVDEEGNAFDRFLHEIVFNGLSDDELE